MTKFMEGLQPSYGEQWTAGTYIVSGRFFLDGNEMRPEQIASDLPHLFQLTKEHKRGCWPRGICGYYLIPIYCAASFSQEVLRLTRRRMRFRWAIWPEPILYDYSRNERWLREDFGLFCCAFMPHLISLIEVQMGKVADYYGHPMPPLPNYSMR